MKDAQHYATKEQKKMKLVNLYCRGITWKKHWKVYSVSNKYYKFKWPDLVFQTSVYLPEKYHSCKPNDNSFNSKFRESVHFFSGFPRKWLVSRRLSKKIIKKLSIKYSVLHNIILVTIGYYFYSQGHKQIRKNIWALPARVEPNLHQGCQKGLN